MEINEREIKIKNKYQSINQPANQIDRLIDLLSGSNIEGIVHKQLNPKSFVIYSPSNCCPLWNSNGDR